MPLASWVLGQNLQSIASPGYCRREIRELRNALIIGSAHNADCQRWQGCEVSQLSVCALIDRQHILAGTLDWSQIDLSIAVAEPGADELLHSGA